MTYRDYLTSSDRSCAIVVHRGIWTDAPENSLLAVERAIAAGHPVVEIDVRKTSDGQFVLLHDDTFARVADVDLAPEDMTMAQISELRLRNRDGGSANGRTGEKVATLDDLFALTRGRIFIHLDVKRREIVPEVLTQAQKAGVMSEVDFWGNLRTTDDLRWFQEVFDGHDIVAMPKTRLNAVDASKQVELAFTLRPVVCEFVYDTLVDIVSVRDRFENAGIATWCNTLDGVACGGHTDTSALVRPDEVWGALIDAGVSVIQTDHADLLRSFLVDGRTP
jgi:hypothetical protein